MSPLTHGSVSLRAFYVEGEPAPDWERACATPLARYAFRPAAIEKGETRSVGWVNPRQVLDADVTLEKLRVGPYVVLALRQDRLALNARIFRARRDLAVAEALRQAGKAHLSKNERQAVEEQVRLEMLRRQTPATQIVEAAWRPDEAVVYAAATSDAAAVMFMELFALTFERTLVPAVAGIRLTRWTEARGLGDRLTELVPATFTTGAAAAHADLVEVLAEAEGDGHGTA